MSKKPTKILPLDKLPGVKQGADVLRAILACKRAERDGKAAQVLITKQK